MISSRRNRGFIQRTERKTSLVLMSNSHFQTVRNVLSMSEKEISKQNNVEKFEIREQNKNKTEAKWKYKVRTSWSSPTTFLQLHVVVTANG